MATTTIPGIELDARDEQTETAPSTAAIVTIDGGYGWVVVFACFIQQFWVNAWTGSWGVFQAALLRQDGKHNFSSSTIPWVGSLGNSLTVALALGVVWLAGTIGSRWAALLGVGLFGMSALVASFTVSNIGGLFVSSALYGIGASLMYSVSNSLPIQWFDKHLGTANGFIKLGGGIGATVTAFTVQVLINRVGIAWTFRAMAFASLVTGLPAALLIKERGLSRSPAFDISLFKNLNYFLLFLAGSIALFALYVPSFFLPTVALSIGLSATTAAGVMACYNACMAVGRLTSGIACDKLGSTNMLFIATALNAVTMLAIWSVADTLAILCLFAALNGIANGAFFVTMPTAISKLLGPIAAPTGVAMAITGWTLGDLLGGPIAGLLIAATQADKATSITPYRSAIFYAGGMGITSTFFVLAARLRISPKLIKKL